MNTKYYFLIILLFATRVMSMPQPSLITEFVTGSELVVIGKLTIVSTRDGHIGSIDVEKLLYGPDLQQESSVRFISDPVLLIQNQSRIWFLHQDMNITNNELQWRICVVNNNSSLPTQHEKAVLDSIVKSMDNKRDENNNE